MTKKRASDRVEATGDITVSRRDAEDLRDILQVSIEELQSLDLGHSLRPLNHEVIARLRELQITLMGGYLDENQSQPDKTS